MFFVFVFFWGGTVDGLNEDLDLGILWLIVFGDFF